MVPFGCWGVSAGQGKAEHRGLVVDGLMLNHGSPMKAYNPMSWHPSALPPPQWLWRESWHCVPLHTLDALMGSGIPLRWENRHHKWIPLQLQRFCELPRYAH